MRSVVVFPGKGKELQVEKYVTSVCFTIIKTNPDSITTIMLDNGEAYNLGKFLITEKE